VSKEFYQLLVRALFSGDYGMFEHSDETREHWFSPAAMATGAAGVDFRLVGCVLGLAIFNGIILDVHFPQVRGGAARYARSKRRCWPRCPAPPS